MIDPAMHDQYKLWGKALMYNSLIYRYIVFYLLDVSLHYVEVAKPDLALSLIFKLDDSL